VMIPVSDIGIGRRFCWSLPTSGDILPTSGDIIFLFKSLRCKEALRLALDFV
jgi:hypothetical protein